MTETIGSIGRAEAYDRHMGRYGPELSAAFLRFAGLEPGMRVLDVGCGPGSLTSALAQLVGAERLAAVDPSEEFVRACRRRVPRADVRVGKAEALPFADRTFDAILSQLVIQSLADAPEAVGEMHRVVSPGGVVAACVWDFRGGMPLLDAYWSAAMAVDPDGAHEAAGDLSDPWCTWAGLDRLWREAGLGDVETAEVSAGADYEDFEDAWFSFAAGASPSGVYCQSLDERRRDGLREAFRQRLGDPSRPFRLMARAWAARGRRASNG